MTAPARPLTVRTDCRGMPYVTLNVRVTGEAHIVALAQAAQAAGRPAATLATEMVTEELRWLAMPRLRQQVRRARAARRAACAAAGNR